MNREKIVEAELVPEHVSRLADAMEAGLVVTGGVRCGKATAARIALARKVGKKWCQIRDIEMNKLRAKHDRACGFQ